jgi:hypothetical protein
MRELGIDRQPIVCCTIAVPDGTVGVRGKAPAPLNSDRDRLRSVLQAQCIPYASPQWEMMWTSGRYR